MAELPVLTYFDGRGRAEIIRIMLCAGKIKVRTFMLVADIHFHVNLKLFNHGYYYSAYFFTALNYSSMKLT